MYESSNPDQRDQFRDIVGIVETKKPERTDGIDQLKSYMAPTSCRWGVWTNGNDIEYVYKDTESGELKSDFIYQIPRKGESLDNIGKITKQDLIPANNLKPIFKRLLNILYSNTNISRREKLGNELIRLIFCKIMDEKYFANQVPKFRVAPGEDNGKVKERVASLFEDVKKELADDGVFESNERITLEAKSITHVVGELQQYSLLKTDKDVIGDAFEVFAESKLAGEKGEFFTPREVVKTAVEFVDPQPEQTIFDPACGSGGFLIYAMEHVWNAMECDPKYARTPNLAELKRDIAGRCWFGIDKELDLVKIAKAYMAIVGDGRGKITQQNTLHKPEEFEGRAKDVFVDDDQNFRKFDIIMTNPPFGSRIKILKGEARSFELGNRITRTKSGTIRKEPKDTDPQELFVERCMSMLNDGGTLAIVLPETYFHAPSKRNVLEFIIKGNNVKAIIDLPHDTFRPHNNAKTILVVLEKKTKQQDRITMAVIEGIGHDAQGRPLYRYDYDLHKSTSEIWDDTVVVRKEMKRPRSIHNKYVFTLRHDEIVDYIYVPRYYWKTSMRKIEEQAESKKCKLVPMSELIDKGVLKEYDGHGSPESKYKGKGNIPYVRVADIVNWDIYKNYTAMVPETEYNRVKGNGVDLKPKDVLFVRRGSYRIGTVALLTGDDLKLLLTREIKIFRVSNNEYSISPEYLVYLLSHKLVQAQLKNLVFLDTTLPNIADRWKELKLPLFERDKDRIEVTDAMKSIFEGKKAVSRNIRKIDRKHGPLTT